MENKHPLNDLIQTTMENIRTVADANTIIGAPIPAGQGHGGTAYGGSAPLHRNGIALQFHLNRRGCVIGSILILLRKHLFLLFGKIRVCRVGLSGFLLFGTFLFFKFWLYVFVYKSLYYSTDRSHPTNVLDYAIGVIGDILPFNHNSFSFIGDANQFYHQNDADYQEDEQRH